MSKYIKIIDKQLRIDEIELAFNTKELAENRLEYIHALDIFMRNKVIKRVKSNNNIHAVTDDQSVNVRLRNGKLAGYNCSCNNDLCKHILATLIAFEREPDTFVDKDNRMKKIIDAYKKLNESIEYNTLEEDIELLNALRALIITSKNDSLSQSIIGLLIISILTNIDKRYEANTMQIVNEKVAENINNIIDAIGSKDQVRTNRSWDNIITELMKVG